MTTSAKYEAGTLRFFDTSTFETATKMSPIVYRDDFIGAGAQVIPAAGSAESGVDWVKKLVQTVGTPTVAAVANAAGGKIACALDATSEKQDAVLYFGDKKAFSTLNGLVAEFVVDLTVLPSASGVQAVWGLASDWIDGPDNNTCYLQFGATANGALLIRSFDGVTTKSVASGVVVTAGVEHVYRIDATDTSDVKFFIDGAQVSTTGLVNFAATGTLAVLQPYCAVYKTVSTGLATLGINSVKIFNGR